MMRTLLMRPLLPADVKLAETCGDLTAPPLFPQEEERVGRSVGKRRREFGTGRRCARAALAQLGIPPAPILTGERGEPLWPPGVVGAITHCEGYRAAAVARSEQVAALGMDAEPAGPLPAGVLDAISLRAERSDLVRLRGAHPHLPWDRLLFSAKESVYKTWFPLAKVFLDFDGADITFVVDPHDPAAGSLRAQLRVAVPAPLAAALGGAGHLDGRWVVRDGLVLTAIAVPTAAPLPASRVTGTPNVA